MIICMLILTKMIFILLAKQNSKRVRKITTSCKFLRN